MTNISDPAGAWKARPQRSTRVQDVLSEWEVDASQRLKLVPRTIAQTRGVFLSLAQSAGEDDISLLTVDHALAWLTMQPSIRTAMHRRSLAGYVFKYAKMRGLVQRNPLECITLPRSSPGKGADYLTKEQACRVIDVARNDRRDNRATGPARSRFYLFLWGTAFRYGEARAQLWSDVDWINGTIRVTRDKAGRNDTVRVADWLLAEMAKWPRVGDRVFHVAPSHHMLARDFAAAGVRGRGLWHRWRKGSISYVAGLGVPIYEVMRFSRHADVRVLTKIYVFSEYRQLYAAQSLMRLDAEAV